MSESKKIVTYGTHPDQFIRLTYSPSTSSIVSNTTDAPVVVLFHGGFWKMQYTLDNSAMDTLPLFFIQQGFIVCEVEYRRREHDGGGFPGTNQDCIDALHKLYELSRLPLSGIDINRCIILGHSAGGYLALWLCCSKSNIQPPLPFHPILCVAIAPIGDLEAAYEARISDEGDAVERFMQGITPTEDTNHMYDKASPAKLLPLSVNCLLISGEDDVDVPIELVNAFYHETIAAREHEIGLNKKIPSSMLVEFIRIDGADHYDLVNAKSSAWTSTYQGLVALLDRWLIKATAANI